MADGVQGRPTAARLIVEALERNGVERIFCVPGESYLALLDALHDSPIAVTWIVFWVSPAAKVSVPDWAT